MEKNRTLNITNSILKKYGIQANKRFGQNFLIDDNILENIVNVSNISKDDLVIEIGPGLGNLTEYLLDVSGHVLLIEIDNKMIEVLNGRFVNKNNYTLLNEDILDVDINEIINLVEKNTNRKYEKIKVVANLPYYITTPIIFKLLEDNNKIDEIIVMVQKEVAERMVAKTRTKDYGILTLMVEYLSTASIEIIVPNTSFVPSPNVTSAVIKLKKGKKVKIDKEKELFELIHKAFAKRRKKMINSLEMSNFMNMNKKSIEKLFEVSQIDKNARAEELNLEEYINIVNKM